MAKGKTYELALKIAGRVDSSLKKACLDADENLGKLAKTAEKIGKAAKVAAGVSANRGRPAENGAAASGASGARFDVAHSTKEQRMALIRRAANGERIEF